MKEFARKSCSVRSKRHLEASRRRSAPHRECQHTTTFLMPIIGFTQEPFFLPLSLFCGCRLARSSQDDVQNKMKFMNIVAKGLHTRPPPQTQTLSETSCFFLHRAHRQCFRRGDTPTLKRLQCSCTHYPEYRWCMVCCSEATSLAIPTLLSSSTFKEPSDGGSHIPALSWSADFGR